MPKPQKSRLTKRADDWRDNIKRTGAKPPYSPRAMQPIDTSKPADAKPVNIFKPDVKLDRSQVSDRRGNSKRSGR